MNPAPTEPTLLYRYGVVAWVWRALGAAAVVGGGALVAVALAEGTLVPALVALPLLAPVFVLFPMVATRITLVDTGAATRPAGEASAREDVELCVLTLAGYTRRIRHDRFEGHTLKSFAEGDVSRIYSPRAWLKVRGAWPVYVDLLAHIPDKRRFAATFGLPAAKMPR